MPRDFNYESNNIVYDDMAADGEGIKCKNYELCESVLPKWWFECKGSYLCTNCHMAFGTWGNSLDGGNNGKGILEISDNIECPLCFENKKGISHPRCDHFVCIDCFKRCQYGDQTGEPLFPYSDVEEEYFEDAENPKWERDYPLIRLYNEECDTFENNKREKYENEANLRLCPLCRK